MRKREKRKFFHSLIFIHPHIEGVKQKSQSNLLLDLQCTLNETRFDTAGGTSFDAKVYRIKNLNKFKYK